MMNDYRWRSIDDLPPKAEDDLFGSEDDWDNRCVVVWQDAECLTDIGIELTNLEHIRDGDYHDERYLKPVWRSLLDAPPFEYPDEYEDED